MDETRSRGIDRYGLVLSPGAYRATMREHGLHSDYDAAAAFGVDRSFISRVRNGNIRAGNHLLAGMIHALEPEPEAAWVVLPKLFTLRLSVPGRPDTHPHYLSRSAARK